MAFFNNLFIRKNREIGGVQIDNVTLERLTNSVRPTNNPVELGVEITDHAIIEPIQYSLNGVVSDTPLGLAALGEIVDNVTGLFGDSTGEGLTRSQAAYALLVQLMNQREPLIVQTGLVLLQGMLITNIDTSRDKDTSGALFFSMFLKEIIIQDTQFFERPESDFTDDTTKARAATQTELGRQLKEPIAEQSIAAKLIDLF